MLELGLSVKSGNWQKFMSRRLSASFKRIAQKIHQRDKHTCQYCGFQAQQYLDVVNHDQNYSNNKAKNLVTACCFCSQCFFLESVGLDNMSGGQLIYLPEIKQNDLNSFCHVLFCAMGNETKYQDAAQILYRNLRQKHKIVEKVFGEGASDPKLFGSLVIEHQIINKTKLSKDVYEGLRLLPLQAKFQVQLDAWAAAAIDELSE